MLVIVSTQHMKMGVGSVVVKDFRLNDEDKTRT